MITVSIEWDKYTKAMIPWTLHNEFLTRFHSTWNVSKLPYDIHIHLSDFWKVTVKPKKLDQFVSHLEALKNNIEDIITVVPLPKEFWRWDMWYDGFKIILDKDWNYPDSTNDIRKTNIEDIKLLADVLIEICRDAKEKNKYVLFRWDGARYNWEWKWDYFKPVKQEIVDNFYAEAKSEKTKWLSRFNRIRNFIK